MILKSIADNKMIFHLTTLQFINNIEVIIFVKFFIFRQGKTMKIISAYFNNISCIHNIQLIRKKNIFCK